MEQNYMYKAKIINVIDGDTVDAIVELGFHTTTTQRLRLIGIDTPELRSKDENERGLAKEAKNTTEDFLLNKDVIIQTEKADSFGRFLATIYIDDLNFNDYLLSKGIAKKYKK